MIILPRFDRVLIGRFLLLALAASLACSDCAQAAEHEETAGGAERHIQPAASWLENQTQRLSYALGMVLGNQFRHQGVEVNPDLYMHGLKDALAGGNTLLTEAEARSAVDMLQRDLKRKPIAPRAVIPAGIEIAFKLDQRLTQGMYMGERWVSPPIFSSLQQGSEAVVEARANVTGSQPPVVPEWIAEDADMVTISSAQKGVVRITVKRAGQSRVKVVAPGLAKDLLIKATQLSDAMQVEISQ